MTWFEWAMLIALSIIWGGSFFFIALSTKELPSFTIVFLRVALASLILWPVLFLLGQKFPKDQQIWKMFFSIGLINNVIPFSLITWGQHHIASGLASILNATTPFFTLLLAHFLTEEERISRNRLSGLVIGFIGVTLIVGLDFAEDASVDTLAQLAVLGAAFLYGLAIVYGRRFNSMGINPVIAATGQLTASTMVLFPLVLLVESPWVIPFPSSTTWLAILGLGALSTALAFILYYRVLATAGAVNISLVTFLIPVSAIILGVLFLNERLEIQHFTGMAIIWLGLAIIDGRFLKFQNS
ncbi:MAG: DMT family transporter [Nitrospinae bacterium]|nr:DMT family transporter [Nitrospinota bacterium]MZH13618.1 DMT family transporter [Nitrospinota bacterium]